MVSTALFRFRLVAFLEGCTYLLFAITMPLKYKMGMPKPNYFVGMAHGVLFLLYIILMIVVAVKYKWGFKKILLAFIASLLPLGTFYAAKNIYPAKDKQLKL